MTTRFWIGAAVGAVIAWYFFTPHSDGSGIPGVGGAKGRPNRQHPRGQAGYSGFGRWR